MNKKTEGQQQQPAPQPTNLNKSQNTYLDYERLILDHQQQPPPARPQRKDP